jgi:hypothetical protein
MQDIGTHCGVGTAALLSLMVVGLGWMEGKTAR